MKLKKDPITAAIIGSGAVGEYHIKAQNELGSHVTVYDPNQERAASLARLYDISVAKTPEAAMSEADVVHICTPPWLHAEGALASIALGKPTIIEKPLVYKLDEAIDIYRASVEAAVPVMVGKHFRLTPPFLLIKEALDKGAIGDITSIGTDYVHDMGRLKGEGVKWRQALGRNGFVHEGAAHPVDLNMWFAGQDVTSLQATVSDRKIRDEYSWGEDVVITLTYKDGTTGRVWANAAAPTPKHGTNVEVFGGRGALRAHNKYPKVDSYTDGDSDWVTTRTAPIGQTIRPMAELMHSFIRGERNNFGPMPDIREALGVMIVLSTVEIAADTGSRESVPALSQLL